MKRRLLGLLLPIGFLFVAAVIGLAVYADKMIQPMPASQEKQRISYPQGTTTAQLAAQLDQKGIIRSASFFSLYLKYKKEGARFQAGEYALAPGITLDEIIESLNSGQTMKEEGIRLTVPEGYTVSQVAQKIQQSYGFDAAAFIKEAQSFQNGELALVAQIPADPAIRVRLEGYLFPETYEWKKEAAVHDIIASMVQQLDKKLTELPDGWQQAMARQGMTFHQMLTVASLIEREVALDEERPIVSGVIYNRLKQGMPLQIDATIQYLFDKPKDRLFEKDLKIESPYNTYLNKGLPPGPIASPSLDSIKAAIYPVDTKYLFYVTKKDGSKGHLFAETFEQHRKNIAESKQ